jgi:hypothetical protein
MKKNTKYGMAVITRDTIAIKGFEQWHSVRYMTTAKDRFDCLNWVIGLIEKGVIKKIA